RLVGEERDVVAVRGYDEVGEAGGVQVISVRADAGDHRGVIHQVADKNVPGLRGVGDARDEIGGPAEEGDEAAVGAEDRGDAADGAQRVGATLLARRIDVDDLDGPGLPVEDVDAVRPTRGGEGHSRGQVGVGAGI